MRTETKKLPKLIVLLGPTASGKTGWSLRLANKFSGEIISADSRQVYKKMTIGTAKVEGEWKRSGFQKKYYVEGIPHYLVDFLDPGKTFTVAEFRDQAIKYIKLIQKFGRVPFLVGGTGLYIQAVVDNLQIPRVPPNNKLRKSFVEKNSEELLAWLQKLDPDCAADIDPKNKRRLIRALEVCILTGQPFSQQKYIGSPIFEPLQIGIQVEKEELNKRIEKRVGEMIKEGLIEEVRNLRRQKYSWELSSMSGIGYREFQGYFAKQKSLDGVMEDLKVDTRRYAKRQLTWFARDKRIKWCETYQEAEKLVAEFLQ